MLLLDVDAVGLVRGRSPDQNFLLAQSVNDWPYVASSFLSAAVARVFGSARSAAARPAAGSAGQGTRRAAWSIGDKKDVVFEAGLDTLTKAEGTVLVHHGTDRTQQMLLVRLEQPPAGK